MALRRVCHCQDWIAGAGCSFYLNTNSHFLRKRKSGGPPLNRETIYFVWYSQLHKHVLTDFFWGSLESKELWRRRYLRNSIRGPLIFLDVLSDEWEHFSLILSQYIRGIMKTIKFADHRKAHVQHKYSFWWSFPNNDGGQFLYWKMQYRNYWVMVLPTLLNGHQKRSWEPYMIPGSFPHVRLNQWCEIRQMKSLSLGHWNQKHSSYLYLNVVWLS